MKEKLKILIDYYSNEINYHKAILELNRSHMDCTTIRIENVGIDLMQDFLKELKVLEYYLKK